MKNLMIAYMETKGLEFEDFDFSERVGLIEMAKEENFVYNGVSVYDMNEKESINFLMGDFEREVSVDYFDEEAILYEEDESSKSMNLSKKEKVNRCVDNFIVDLFNLLGL